MEQPSHPPAGDRRGHDLARDGAPALEPVGALDFSALTGDDPAPGGSLHVGPALYTADGLLIEKAFQGGPGDSGCSGRVELLGEMGRVLESAASGFA